MKISLIGKGYVGQPLVLLLAQHNKVVVIDINTDFVEKNNTR